jgi:hypothetical protein
MFRADQLSDLFFELRDFRPLNENAALEDTGESSGEFSFERMVLSVNVEKRNGHEK